MHSRCGQMFRDIVAIELSTGMYAVIDVAHSIKHVPNHYNIKNEPIEQSVTNTHADCNASYNYTTAFEIYVYGSPL